MSTLQEHFAELQSVRQSHGVDSRDFRALANVFVVAHLDELVALAARQQQADKQHTEGPCKCGLKTIPAYADAISWYWQMHARDKCTLELPNERCWCGLLRSEHLEGHADKQSEKVADSGGGAAQSAEDAPLRYGLTPVECGNRPRQINAAFFPIPADLNRTTAHLLLRFATAVADKLTHAQRKYGWTDNWLRGGWREECQRHLLEHLAKGDPRDVAAYCAFLWHHEWPTVAATVGLDYENRQAAGDERPHKHWRVEVETSGEHICAIETSMLAGRNLSAADEATIREAARHLLAFVGEPQQREAAGGWQPISTAPKDGTNVIISGPGGVEIGNWEDEKLDVLECGVIVEPGMKEGWVGVGVHWPEGDQPTHWMPLPESPE